MEMKAERDDVKKLALTDFRLTSAENAGTQLQIMAILISAALSQIGSASR